MSLAARHTCGIELVTAARRLIVYLYRDPGLVYMEGTRYGPAAHTTSQIVEYHHSLA